MFIKSQYLVGKKGVGMSEVWKNRFASAIAEAKSWHSYVVSVVCNEEGRIVYINKLVVHFGERVKFIPVQRASECLEIVFEPLEYAIPRDVAYITWDNQIVRQGFCYLGKWKSCYTPTTPMHHVANALGDIRVFYDVDMAKFASEHTLTYFDYEAFDKYGVLQTSESFSAITDKNRYATKDFGAEDYAWMEVANISAKSGYANFGFHRSDYCQEEAAVLTSLSFGDESSTTFLLPNSIINPWVYHFNHGSPVTICYPSEVHSYGLNVDMETLSVNFPENVYRDVFINILHTKVQQKEWVVPIHMNAYIKMQAVTGLKTLVLKLSGDMPNTSNNVFIDITSSSVEDLIIDYDEPWVLYLYCDESLKRVTINSPVTGKSWTKRVLPPSDTTKHSIYGDLVSRFVDTPGVIVGEGLVIGASSAGELGLYSDVIHPCFAPFEFDY